mmetsp:Transcript_9195/g.21929  ORF Transcript_9195/g.21929 Transcript_9195/m.21929 type:complete len:669 (+) Transcript_9195:326-2332(+)
MSSNADEYTVGAETMGGDTFGGDTFGGDTFAEAGPDETGPAPNQDEFTQYDNRTAAGDYTRTGVSTDADDFTTSQFTEDPDSGYSNVHNNDTEDPGRAAPPQEQQGPIEGPYYDDTGRPYYINSEGQPYYDDNYQPPESAMSLVPYDPQTEPEPRQYEGREYAETGNELMVYDPDMAYAEEDDDDYDYDEGEPINMRETFEEEIVEDESKRRARRRRAWCCCLICLCCLLLLLLLGVLYLLLKDKDGDKFDTPAPTFSPWIDDTDDDFYYNDDIVLQPGYITSCMADFDGNCDFEDQSCFPNVVDQCNCNSQIELVPDDVKAMREMINERVTQRFFGENFTLPINQCHPINMATIWMASGNNRDAGHARQRLALAINYYALNGTIWDYDDAWMSDLNECLWLGVQCNNRDAINSMQMDTNNLFGQFPTEIGLLIGLASISASRVHLTGTIPTELFGMPRLRELRLYGNRITGTIPTEIGNSPVLRGFRMETNFISGNIPSEVGRTRTLTDLNLGFNRMKGTVPSELGELQQLINLRFASNELSGFLPTEIGRLNSLEVLGLSENLFTANLPTHLGLLWKLRDLRAASIGVGGFMPTELGLLTDMQRLELGYNGFSGRLISEIGALTNMCKFYLRSNHASGYYGQERCSLLTFLFSFAIQSTLVSTTID